MWQNIVDKAIDTCIQRFASDNLKADELSLSLINLSDSANLHRAGYRQDELVYPASIVKLFYAVAAYQWLQQGKFQKTAEFDRAMSDMIVLSYNDATSYIVDLLTGTVSGPELTDAEMKLWSQKRNVINDYFHSCNYAEINLNQKPWAEGPYGREKVFVGKNAENRNMLTAAATSRLMHEIVSQRAAQPEYCAELMTYMQRCRLKPVIESEDQIRGFIGEILPAGAKFWSKAGWTSKVRHDAVYVELERHNLKFCLVVFTINHSSRPQILQTLAAEIVSALLAKRGQHLHG